MWRYCGLSWDTAPFHLAVDFFFQLGLYNLDSLHSNGQDWLARANQMSAEDCFAINPNKMPCHKKAVEHYFYPLSSYPSASAAEIVIVVCRSAGVLSLWRFSREDESPREKRDGHHNCNGFGSFSASVTSAGCLQGKSSVAGEPYNTAMTSENSWWAGR